MVPDVARWGGRIGWIGRIGRIGGSCPRPALLLVGAMLAAACSGSIGPVQRSTDTIGSTAEAAEAPEESATRAGSSSSGGVGPDPLTSDDSGYVFDQDRLHTFEITLTPQRLAELDADPTAEEYVEGTLRFEGHEIEDIGVRYKGSVGAFVGCLSGSQPLQPSGHKTCTKLSIKLRINWTDPEREFFGLRRIQLHAQNLDPTQLHERLGYWLLAEMGVPAPRSVHARVVVNGEYVGLFALTEQIDGRFTRHHFDDGTGNLYKEVWPLDAAGQPRPDQAYLDGLRTNEGDGSSPELISAFAHAMASSDDPAATLAEFVDIEQLLATAAVDRTIRHDDGPFHFYCFDGCGNHNFYWYEEPESGLLHLVPWDLDNAFENIARNANPVTPIADEFGEITNDCQPFAYGPFGIQQRSATCDPIFAAMAGHRDLYEDQVARLIAGPLSPESVAAQVDTWTAQIAAATAEADDAHHDALTVSEWRSAMEQLLADLEIARGADVS